MIHNLNLKIQLVFWQSQGHLEEDDKNTTKQNIHESSK